MEAEMAVPNDQAKSLVERIRKHIGHGYLASLGNKPWIAKHIADCETLLSHIEAVEGERDELNGRVIPGLNRQLTEQFELSSKYIARAQSAERQLDLLRAERDEWNSKWANLKADRDLWPLEVRETIDRLEDEHDVSICSGQHLAVWVDRTEAAEKEAALLRAELDAVYQDRARDTIKASEQIVRLERKEEALRDRVTFDADLAFWAFRYALGRMTYAVSDVAMALIAHRQRIPAKMREMICREITEAEERGGLGHACDQRSWLEVRATLSSEPTDGK